MIDIDAQVLSDLSHGFNLPPKPEILQQLQDELALESPELN